MYKGIITNEFKNIRFRTILDKPFEDINKNDFKKAITSSNLKPLYGFWGCFEDKKLDVSDNYAWENYLLFDDDCKYFPDGVWGIDYKLPDDIKICVIKVNEDLNKQLYTSKDLEYKLKDIIDNYDVLIELTGEETYSIPSICINNYETLKKIKIENYWYKDDLDKDKIFFIKNNVSLVDNFKKLNKEDSLIKINECGYYLKFLSEEQKNDVDIVTNAILKNIICFNFASKELREDENFCSKMSEHFNFINIGSLLNKDILKDILNKKEYFFPYINEQFKDNYDICLNACTKNGDYLQYVSDRLKNDKDVVLMACINDRIALKYASDELKNDKKFILEVIKRNGSCYEYISNELKDDEEILKIALNSSSYKSNVFKHANDRLRNNKDIFMFSCDKDLNTFIYASDEIKKNKDIIYHYLKKEKNALFFLNHCDKTLLNDKNFLIDCVKIQPESFSYFNNINSDNDIILECIDTNGLVLKFLSNDLKKDKDICLKAIKQNGKALKYVDSSLKNDFDLCLEACKNNGDAIFCYVGKERRRDKDFLVEAINKNIEVIFWLGEGYLDDETFLKNCLKKSNDYIEFCTSCSDLSNSYRKNVYNVALELLKDTNFSLDYNIDYLKNLSLDNLDIFFKERYHFKDYDLNDKEVFIELESKK